MKLDAEVVKVLMRYRNGDKNIPAQRLAVLAGEMEYHRKRLLKARTKLEIIEREWEEQNVEDHYKERIWYNAHRRLAKWEGELSTAIRGMFSVLTRADGISVGAYHPLVHLGADEIYAQWQRKYGTAAAPSGGGEGDE